jgi:biopolymer transport protein ExbD
MAKGRKKQKVEIADADMTPMIDMTFQLIAFFMVLINFSQSEQNDKVTLPESELAKPAAVALDFPIIIHMPSNGGLVIGGVSTTIDAVKGLLDTEITVLKAQGKTAADANIIIRSHNAGAGGQVQDLIEKCQQLGFERFALRVKEKNT